MSTLSTDQLLHAYRVMRTIRAFEERLHVEFATGEIPGFVHLYAGEEASAAGVMAHLRDDDCIASTHRGHGHCIAKGVDVHGMMAEIYGKKTGVCQGKGGSMHIADLEKGMLGANGIVGARAPPGPRPPPGGHPKSRAGGGGGLVGAWGAQQSAGFG
ncbi:thiamine pyrophosphate-dependent enzyme, partial [Pseudomonas aeruginosa]|uniref:thiamine pyrophosphate-dependent enzyme n=1 Tax=Pseudomonas aeruginosa TaxID=287 RepID=UPI001F4971A5